MLSVLLLYIYHSFAITHCCYYCYHRGTKNHHYQVQLMTQALHNKVVKSYKIRHPFRMVSTHFRPCFVRLDSDVLEFLSGFLRVNLLILLVVQRNTAQSCHRCCGVLSQGTMRVNGRRKGNLVAIVERSQATFHWCVNKVL